MGKDWRENRKKMDAEFAEEKERRAKSKEALDAAASAGDLAAIARLRETEEAPPPQTLHNLRKTHNWRVALRQFEASNHSGLRNGWSYRLNEGIGAIGRTGLLRGDEALVLEA
eukprot:gene4634-15501_t